MIIDEGLNEIATRIASDITKGQWGTGTTAEAATDTGLETAVAATLLTLTAATASGNSAQFVHELSSALGNSNTLTEFELQFDDGDSLNRTVGAGIAKTSSFTMTTITGVNFVRAQ